MEIESRLDVLGKLVTGHGDLVQLVSASEQCECGVSEELLV